ncbi:MAG: type II toxin-antitoxin system RelE/ParE family toxin [Leptolyngbyaceae cyanobacterium SU_3_3]|nr:type II toxin-antitoxin system RelE/ParE family toxin [Leptolyngbyaceae cyanobacterium SU_3_3]
MRIVFLSLAVKDLAAIRAYIAEDDPEAAKAVASRLKQLIKRLSSMPNLGKPGRVFGSRELITPKLVKQLTSSFIAPKTHVWKFCGFCQECEI